MYTTPWIMLSAERQIEAHVPGTVITQQSAEDHTVDLVVRDLYLHYESDRMNHPSGA
jgi:hypothetical protein